MKSYEDWLKKGYHGEMKFMERQDRLDRRRDPSIILPGLKSIVMVLEPYWPGVSSFPVEHKIPHVRNENDGGKRGVVSCYAWTDDYHERMQEKLRVLGEWLIERTGGVSRYYVDTGAIFERDFAERCGLGFIGKNSMLIHPIIGSGTFIGALFTTIDLPIDGDGTTSDERGRKKTRGKPGCGKCTKCIVACPTDAIVDDRTVDARKCISYLTIELKGSIPEELRDKMGARIYGCDICQVVCPWNKLDWGKDHALGRRYERDVTTPELEKILRMDEEEFKKRFEHSAALRIGLERMQRNAAIALGNVGGREDIQVLERICDDGTSDLVREHASWAIEAIRKRHGSRKDAID